MLQVQGDTFILDGQPLSIYSGAIHYFRTVPEYWEDRLTKLKLAGFNTVETYVCWNLHEPQPGEFDFSGMLDIERFLKTAQDLGLYAIVRPGPYICSEWDFGGLPAWLLRDPGMRVRCMHEAYLAPVRRFYKELLARLAPLQITQGGNIIAMQIENEYGSYGNDKAYLAQIEKIMRENGTDVLLFTSDGGEHSMLSGGTLPHIFKTANFGSRSQQNFSVLRKYQPQGPMMCMEFWNGWFDHWGEDHHSREPETVVQELRDMLAQNASFNFYMFHGGTNFGYTSGANHDGSYQPTVTSYDDDALLNEWGGYTPKYHAVREVLLQHQGLPKQALPPEPALQSIGAVELTRTASLLPQAETLGTVHQSVTAESMEHFGQNFGMILYRHELQGSYPNQTLHIDGLHDRAYVFVNGEYTGKLYRNDENHSLPIDLPNGGTIEVLVEAMGRVNYGTRLYDRKGIRQLRLGNQVLSHFTVVTLPLADPAQVDFNQKTTTLPVFMQGEFQTDSNADCFVHLPDFQKGMVWINGFHLGRYWEVGPQKSLYVPGTILKKTNTIVVLEQEGYTKAQVQLLDWHDIG